MPKAANKEICSKCGVNPRMDPEGTNPWCAQCHSAQQVLYRQGLIERARREGKAEGIKAMRAAAVARFRQWPTVIFKGCEVAANLEIMPVPIDRT